MKVLARRACIIVDMTPTGPHRARLACALLAVAAAGCGAKTGLLVPDVESPHDATLDVTDVTDVTDVPRVRGCVPGHFTLASREADALLVIDRSGSMAQGLDGRRGASKWTLLRAALASTLPRFQDVIHVGALFYPEDGADTRTAACTFANVPTVDIAPAYGAASRVLSVFDTTEPGGSTPTAAALLRAYTYFVRHPSTTRAPYIVLATDGAPNCNGGLDPSTCVCAGGGGGRGGRGGCGGGDANRCLDDRRTVAQIEQIASNPVTPIPTFVIGIADTADPTFASTLTAMAVAGGRPNRTASGAPTYYDVRQEGDLTRAFTAVQNAIARCTLVAPSHPSSRDTITLTVDGAAVARDTAHVNGWDWTDRAVGEITLFGAACPSDAPPRVVSATVECSADAG